MSRRIRGVIIDPDSIAAKILFVVGLLLIGLSVVCSSGNSRSWIGSQR